MLFVCGTGAMLNEVILDGKAASVECELLVDTLVAHVQKDIFLNVCGDDFMFARAVMDSMSLKVRRL